MAWGVTRFDDGQWENREIGETERITEGEGRKAFGPCSTAIKDPMSGASYTDAVLSEQNT